MTDHATTPPAPTDTDAASSSVSGRSDCRLRATFGAFRRPAYV